MGGGWEGQEGKIRGSQRRASLGLTGETAEKIVQSKKKMEVRLGEQRLREASVT